MIMYVNIHILWVPTVTITLSALCGKKVLVAVSAYKRELFKASVW